MTVLIVSSMDDVHARAVLDALIERGASVELLDLSEFPMRLALSADFEGGARRYTLNRNGGGRLDLSTIGAVWWRRPQAFRLPVNVTGASHRQFALSEASTALHGVYQSLDAFWVNDPNRDAEANHKPWQLAVAQQLGLTVPTTLMTNDPEEARDFWRRHEGQIIYKQFRALPDAWRETRRLRPEESGLAEAVRLAPVIFQRFVDAVADLRVTVIGDRIFAASTDSRKGEYLADVRFNLDAQWEAHTLPPAVEEKLLRLMRRLGLEYGAIDLRLTPDGEYVFLEVNPAGQFLWIEHATGLKIAAALAEHLAAAQPSRQREASSAAVS